MSTPATAITSEPWALLAILGACVVALAAATILLLLGRRLRTIPLGRLRFASESQLRMATQVVSILLGIGLAASSALIAARVWDLQPGEAAFGAISLAAAIAALVFVKPRWNLPAHLFAGAFAASSVVYLTFGSVVTFGGYFGAAGSIGAGVLLILEIVALALAASFVFESLDAVCILEPPSPHTVFDPDYQPMVSLHIAAYNEPPDVLIEAIRTAEAIDYPRLEIVVIDNNTRDPDLWMPVRDYCEGRPRVTFVHVEALGPGYKSGALNLALERYTDPEAGLIGVIDADQLVRADYLKDLVAMFADPSVAFVQTPPDYRAFEQDRYLTACYDGYGFFLTSMPLRDGRNSMMFAGAMGLFRRDVLEDIGGWSEWCVTENAEASFRMLRDGHQGIFVSQSCGRGIMPPTFAALKEQRFRWCFGGMQILRMHWRDLMPWSRDPRNHLSRAQRIDYLLRSLRWLSDLVLLGFSAVLLSIAGVLVIHGSFPAGPLLVLAALVPLALISSSLLRAFWALEAGGRIGARRAVLAFASSLALSWAGAIACVNGLLRRKRVFFHAHEQTSRRGLVAAMGTTGAESLLAALLWGSGLALALSGMAGPLLVVLFVGQGTVYASAPLMAWMNQRTELTEQERRRLSAHGRVRVARVAPFALGLGVPGAIAAAAIALSVFGVATSTPPTADPFFGSDDGRALGASFPTPPVAPETSAGPNAPRPSPAVSGRPPSVVSGSIPLSASSPSATMRPPGASFPPPSGSPPPPSVSPTASPTATSPPPSPTETPSPTEPPSPTETPSSTSTATTPRVTSVPGW